MIPNVWHFSFHHWVLCLRWYGLGLVVALLTP
ncbi:TPA: hypothetical protein GRI80_24000 [Vibrio parahaemolyticus]|nr:hypothetical protein BSG32_12005 [Vibrio parahaemolyticus]EGQ9179463.1 hypothetical protein [Vibrio alginolyticus]EGQ8686243.1 hypothetical protein [Vibrio parahaemolyticus]EGQ8784327.1 hypothetical protein [Vibrio parahaemolyticus]EGQ8832843.1 hypothetical protein [Vibrio parahaemolyticus]